jgi:hypothetical protein
MPETGGIQIPAIESLLVSTYQLTAQEQMFEMSPLGPTRGLIPQMVFANGQYSIDGQPVAIRQILFGSNGISINAQDTDAANQITDHIFSLLNTNLKFRFNGLKRKYLSSLVVHFERDFESLVRGLSEVQKVILEAVGKTRPEEMALKRLGFGPETPGTYITVSLENIDKIDFVIERRAGHPFSENRYFSAAPVQTADHIRALEQIEKILSASP